MAHDPKNCELCKKQGLPILLTRYAIAHIQTPNAYRWYNDIPVDKNAPPIGIGSDLAPVVKDSKVPRLGGAFRVEPRGVDIDMGPTVGYTQRLLRAGYLYVYNPNDKATPWRGYVVTENAYLLPFKIGKNGPVQVGEKYQEESEEKPIEPCDRSTTPEVARIITLDLPSSKVPLKPAYIAFSDVQWTKAVWKKHNANEDGYRDRNMRKFDVQKWVDSSMNEHAAVMDELEQHVADYSEEVNRFAFSFSVDNFPYHTTGVNGHNKSLPKSVRAICEKKPYDGKVLKGVILALDDPAGIVADLATLAEFRDERFKQRATFSQKKELQMAIKSLYDAMTYDTDIAEGMAAARKRQDDYIDSLDLGIKYLPGKDPNDQFEYCTQPRRELTKTEQIEWKKRGIPTELELAKARKEAWEKYEKKIDVTSLQNFIKISEQELSEFQKDSVFPLTKAHALWLEKSELLRDYLLCNFDPKDGESCQAYSLMVSHLISSTQQWEDCAALYQKWYMSEDPSDKTNYLLRALIVNNDDVADIFKEGAAALENLKNATFVAGQDKATVSTDPSIFNNVPIGLVKNKLAELRSKTVENVTEEDIEQRWKEIWLSLISTVHSSLSNIATDGKGYLTLIRGEAVNDTVAGKLVAQLVRPLAGVLNKCAPLSRFTPAVIAAAAINRTPVIALEITGTRKELTQLFSTEMKMSAVNNKDGSSRQLHGSNREIVQRFAVLEGEDPDLRNPENKKITVVVMVSDDYFELKRVKQEELKIHGRGTGRNKLEKSIAQLLIGKLLAPASQLGGIPYSIDLEKARELNMACLHEHARSEIMKREIAYGEVFQRNQKKLRVKFVRNVSKGLTGFGLAIQLYSFYVASETLDKLDKNKKDKGYYEAWSKFYGGMFATIGTGMEALADGLKTSHALRRYRVIRFLSTKYGRMISTVGKRFGLIGAIAGAFWDLSNARDVWQKGQYGMVAGYTASGILGVYSTWVILGSLTNPWGWVLLIASFGLGFVVNYFKDDPYQDWLGKTLYGGDDVKFPTHGRCMFELKMLFGEPDKGGAVEVGDAVFEETPDWHPGMRLKCSTISSID